MPLVAAFLDLAAGLVPVALEREETGPQVVELEAVAGVLDRHVAPERDHLVDLAAELIRRPGAVPEEVLLVLEPGLLQLDVEELQVLFDVRPVLGHSLRIGLAERGLEPPRPDLSGCWAPQGFSVAGTQ